MQNLLHGEDLLARSYDVAIAALTVGVPHKWVDNLLSRHQLTGVQCARQGVTRRLSQDALSTIAIVWMLTEELGLPVTRAVEIAERLTTSGDARLTFGEGSVLLAIDRAAVGRQVADRMAEAIESAPRRRRGRPPKDTKA